MRAVRRASTGFEDAADRAGAHALTHVCAVHRMNRKTTRPFAAASLSLTSVKHAARRILN